MNVARTDRRRQKFSAALVAVCLFLGGVESLFTPPDLEGFAGRRIDIAPVRRAIRATLQGGGNRLRSSVMERKSCDEALTLARATLQALRELGFISIASRERQLAALVIDGDGRSPPNGILKDDSQEHSYHL